MENIEVKEFKILSPLDKIKHDPVVELITDIVFNVTGKSTDDLVVKSREIDLVYPRQLCMYFIKKHTSFSLKLIGFMYNRDHSTVIHAIKVINNLNDVDKRVKEDLRIVEGLIDSYKNKNKPTKYHVLNQILDKTELSEEEKKYWISKYLDAL